MREPVTFFVEGTPKGQPRARATIRGKHAGVYDPGTADGWKAAVAEVWRNVARSPEPFTGAVSVRLDFYMKRPAGHYGSGKNAGTLKATAPALHTSAPDLDNLAKAVLDVLTRLNAWPDDRLVTKLTVSRHWCDSGTPGCMIILKDYTP
jgi:Holliday junction resolvase RusA-like endonuclease